MLDIPGIRRHAGAYAGNDEGIGQTALEGIMGGIFQRPITERDGVFDMDIGKNLYFGGDGLTIAQSVEGISLNQALIGQHGAAVDIDTDKTAAAGCAQGERGACIVAQDIEPDRYFDGLPHRAADRGHGRHCFGADGGFRKRHIAKILDEDRMRAALLISSRIPDSSLDDGLPIAAPAWRSRER
ncbi:MAG: hypothetical protein JWR26_884 [Pedosphaera sp.]|nr:hypothetical protein [Pedosphaera sp.]